MPLKIGGKYIAEGSYGCVFGDPPLKCLEDKERLDDSYISKLMFSSDVEIEVEEGKRWMVIDPEGEFSISPYRVCKLDPNSIRTENNYNKCSIKDMYVLKKKGYLVFYKNGGLDLTKLEIQSKNYEPLFSGFQNLWDGLIKAHKNKLVHLDIKPNNILKGEKEFKLRFIDFGLSLKTDEVYEYNEVYTENTSYYSFWPFELGCFNSKGVLKSKAEIKNRFLMFNKSFSSNGTISGLTKFLQPFDTLYKTLLESEKNFKNIQETLEKVDVFSMGVTLIQMMRIYFHHSPIQDIKGENYLVFYDSRKNRFSTFDTLKDKNWMTEKQCDYQLELYKNLTQPLVEFINHCVDFNPNTRYNAKKAADEYRNLLPLFKKYLQKNDIKKMFSSLDVLNEHYESPYIPTPKLVKKQFMFRNLNTRKKKRERSNSPNKNL